MYHTPQTAVHMRQSFSVLSPFCAVSVSMCVDLLSLLLIPIHSEHEVSNGGIATGVSAISICCWQHGAL